MGIFGAADGWGGGGAKRWHVTHPLSPADISSFLPEISKFCYVNKCMYTFHFDIKCLIILPFPESLRIFFIKKLQFWWCQQKWLPLSKYRYFEIKTMTSDFMSMTSPTNFYHVIQIILWMSSCDQSLVTLTFLWEKLS